MADNNFYKHTPGLASYFMGQQMAQERNQQDLTNALLSQKAQRESQMLPLDMQYRQGEIAQQNAMLPGYQGQAQSLASKGQFDQQTLSSSIASQISKNMTGMGEDDVKQMSTYGQKLGLIGQSLASSNIPDAAKPAAAKEMMQKYGINPDQGFIQKVFQSKPEDMTKTMIGMGQGMALASQEYLQKQALQTSAQKSHEGVAAGNNATSIRVAEINNAGRLAAANARASLSAGKPMSTDQKIVALSSIPAEERTLAENEQLQQLSQQRLQERAAGANPLAAGMVGGQSAQDVARTSSPFQGNSAPQAHLPAGLKQIGTSGGKPVYEDANGKRFIGD